jgi:hypothetical protein
MKKLILALVLISGLNSAQAQRQLDTTDFLEGHLAQVAKDAPRSEVFTGSGKLNHRSSIGKLKNIFNDSGVTFEEIFGQISSEFPGVVYADDMSVPYIKLENYFIENIKDHVYDSLRYSKEAPKYIQKNGRSILVERESIDCYDSEQKRVRFIQITRYNGEIVSVLDNAPELKQN